MIICFCLETEREHASFHFADAGFKNDQLSPLPSPRVPLSLVSFTPAVIQPAEQSLNLWYSIPFIMAGYASVLGLRRAELRQWDGFILLFHLGFSKDDLILYTQTHSVHRIDFNFKKEKKKRNKHHQEEEDEHLKNKLMLH